MLAGVSQVCQFACESTSCCSTLRPSPRATVLVNAGAKPPDEEDSSDPASWQPDLPVLNIAFVFLRVWTGFSALSAAVSGKTVRLCLPQCL